MCQKGGGEKKLFHDTLQSGLGGTAMSKRVGLMGAAAYRYLAIFLWCFFPLAGVASGVGLLGAGIGVAFSPKGSVGLMLLFLTASPLAFAISTGLGIWLGLRAWREGKVGNADKQQAETALDAALRAGINDCTTDLPPDLSTNKDHFEGFGR
jgi:hypothetical protein